MGGGINFSSFHGAQEKLQKIFRVNFRFFKMDFADVKVRVGGGLFFARLWLVAKQKRGIMPLRKFSNRNRTYLTHQLSAKMSYVQDFLLQIIG